MLIKPNQTYCFMDYETTGVNTDIRTKVRPIQIGLEFTNYKFEPLVGFAGLIKWDSILEQEDWSHVPEMDDTYSQMQSYHVHKIKIDDLRKKGLWPYEVRDAIRIMIKDVVKPEGRKPVIISDAPNFEMFWTKFIFGPCTEDSFPFHFNAWSIYPTCQLLNIEINKISTEHDAYEDAKSMRIAMQMAYKQAREFEYAKKLLEGYDKNWPIDEMKKVMEEYKNED